MAVVHFEEITGRTGSQDVNTDKRYTRTFQVLCSTPQDGASVVLSHPGIPAFNDFYEYVDDSTGTPVAVVDDQSVCVERRVEQSDRENPQNWTVVVNYAGLEDPTTEPAEVDIDPVPYQKSLVDDVNGVPVVNSATDPFEGGITVDRTRFRLVIVKNVLTFDTTAMLPYQDSLNAVAFMGHEAGTCKLTFGAKRIRRRGTLDFYWQRRASIDIDREGWKVKPRDAGFRTRLDGEAPVNIVDTDGTRPATPVLLDGGGQRLLPGDVPKIAGPTLSGFDGYETKDWTPLGLEY